MLGRIKEGRQGREEGWKERRERRNKRNNSQVRTSYTHALEVLWL